jgi:glycerol kinase
VGTVDTWLINRLSGGAAHVTDVSNASRTLLCDIRRGLWDDTLLELFRVPRRLLPEIRPSSGVVAETDPALFGRPLPIAGVAGDQQAALFGQLCGQPGMVKNTYGTGCFMLMHTGGQMVESCNNLVSTVAWQLGPGPLEYALEGSVFIAGAAIQWLRDGLSLIASANEINNLAARVPDAGGVYFVPAFAGLGAPSSVSPVVRPPRTSPAPLSRASPTRSPTSWRRWWPMRGPPWPSCGSTGEPPPATCSCNSKRTCSVSPFSDQRSRRRLRLERHTWRGSG